MRLVATLLAAVVHVAVLATCRRWKVIVVIRGRRLLSEAQDSRSVPSTVKWSLRADAASALAQHGGAELPRHVVLEQTRAVLAEARGVEGRVGDVEVEEPLEQQVVLQPLAELALGRTE